MNKYKKWQSQKIAGEMVQRASVCNSIGIINHGRKFDGRITVIMVAEEVGF